MVFWIENEAPLIAYAPLASVTAVEPAFTTKVAVCLISKTIELIVPPVIDTVTLEEYFKDQYCSVHDAYLVSIFGVISPVEFAFDITQLSG